MSLVGATVLIVCGLLAVSATPARYDWGSRPHNCRKCNSIEECFQPPNEGCKYGIFKDSCGYLNCFRGPSESCSHSGTKRCAEGLSCLCGKCTGCYMESADEPECYIRLSACTNNFV